jgi:hypothetical protein
MAEWHVDRGLETLVTQEKQKHPGMVVGTIAGGGHAQTGTDHVPDPTDKADPHGVDAADFMIGSHFTAADAESLFQALLSHRDPRIAYVIYNRRIFSSTVSPWDVRKYTGTSDPHTNHVHVSVNDKHIRVNSAWELGGKTMRYEELKGYGLPILTAGMDDADYDGYNGVVRAQVLLGIQGQKLTPDGVYGPKMTAAVKAVFGGDGKHIDSADWVKLAGLSRAV